ncbi:MAG: rhamnulokinase [Planctomycetota bacterium]|nr:MAG: rhamnulokinase [Planctomycetota bacterium]
MAGNAYIAIDLGAESGRTIVGLVDRGRLHLAEIHRFRHLARQLPSGLHWDLMGLWGNILEGVACAVDWADSQGQTLTSLGVDTWGVDYALLGQSGELLAMPHCYRDERNNVAFDRAVEAVGAETLYDATGIQLLPLNTLFQVLAQHAAEPELLTRAQQLLFMPDLLHYFFTGRTTCEATIASTSQMTDARTGTWNLDLLAKLALPTQMLQDIVPPGTNVGTILPHVAAATGASEQLQVVAPASHDTASAIAAVPAEVGTSWAYISSGTWSLMGAELPGPCVTPAARAANFTNEGGVDGTIRFLKNLIGLWPVQECRRALENSGQTLDYAALTAAAADAEPFRTLLDLNYPPLMSPGEMPRKIADFARASGQPEPESAGQLVRCCLESLALLYRRTLDELEAVLERKFDVLHVVGGGGRNELLNQFTANAVGRPVVVGPEEATAAGNVLVQAMAAGQIANLAELRKVVRTSFEPKRYEPEDTDAWSAAAARFAEIIGG